MRTRSRRHPLTRSGRARVFAVAAVAVTVGAAATVTFVSGGGRFSASAEANLEDFVPIEEVAANVVTPQNGPDASTGVFTVDCGVNENGKFSADNPVAQPGVENGAEHLHDFVGNLDIAADTSDEELAASGTTCRNGDQSSYFWPVVRIDRSVRSNAAANLRSDAAANSGVATVSCPSVGDRLPAVPAAAADEVNRNLAELDRQVAEANERLVTARGEGGPNFIDNAIMRPLRDRRIATLDRIANAIDRRGPRPTGLTDLADCALVGEPGGTGDNGADDDAAGDDDAEEPAEEPAELAEPSGPNLELPNNTGEVVRPAEVLIEYRGNPTSKVTPMPRFMRALTGDSKPISRGPANARNSWTCSGFDDRLSDKYPICPEDRQVLRVHDFPGCWDGENIDSENHRSHLSFADPATGACPDDFVAIPQLRITIAYDIPQDVQVNGQYALDSFPEEDHNPFSDHNDFLNVNSERQMEEIAQCINSGQNCQ